MRNKYLPTGHNLIDQNFKDLCEWMSLLLYPNGKFKFLSNADPQDVSDDDASPGVLELASRSDHVHFINMMKEEEEMDEIYKELAKQSLLLAKLTDEEISDEDVENEIGSDNYSMLRFMLYRNTMYLEKAVE